MSYFYHPLFEADPDVTKGMTKQEKDAREKRIQDKIKQLTPSAGERAMDGMQKGSIGGPYGAIGGAIDGYLNGPLYKTTVPKAAALRKKAEMLIDQEDEKRRLAEYQAGALPNQQTYSPAPMRPQPHLSSSAQPGPALITLQPSRTQIILVVAGIGLVLFFVLHGRRQ